ncbi:MAG TPA: hypothetical protein VF587_12725, partial [Solirubrobacteraceae bacterium]
MAPAPASAAPPANDDYQQAQALPLDSILGGTTVEATTQDGLPEPLTPASGLTCPGAPPTQLTHSVWYLVTPPTGSGDPPGPTMSVNTIGSTANTVIAVYNTNGTDNGPPDASDPGANVFGCDDDAAAFTTASRVEWTAQPGFSYLVQVGIRSGTTPGDIQTVAAEVPANDDRAGAVAVTDGSPETGDTFGASEEDDEDLVCTSPIARPLASTVWFAFEA